MEFQNDLNITTISASTSTTNPPPTPDTHLPRQILLILTAVLGILASILAIIYAYIYCVKIRPRRRPIPEDRIGYYDRDVYLQYGGSCDKDQQERIPIKTHPFFVLSYMSRLKSSDHSNQVY